MDHLRAAQHHVGQATRDLKNELLNLALYELKLAARAVERLLAKQELSQ